MPFPFHRTLPLAHALLSVFAFAQQPAPSPTDLGQNFQIAVSAYQAGHLSEAATELELLARQAPDNFSVHELLGLVYGAQSRNAQAVDQLQTAVSLNAQSASAHANLGTGLVRAGEPAKAQAEWQKALTIEPANYGANHSLAEFFLRENKVAEAQPYLEAAQHARPTAADNGYDLALADLLLGRYPECRQLIATLQQGQDSGELHSLLGRLDEKEGKFVGAANEFAAAAHMDPTEDNLFVWASELLLHRAYDPAIRVFETGTERFPSSPRLWIGLGMARYSRGEYDPSIHALLTAADLDPTDPRCYLFLSKAYLSAPSQAEDVIGRFHKYATLEPNNALAQFYYAISLWKGRRIENPDVDYATVEAVLKKSIALNGNLPEAHLQLGILYNDQHAFEKSLPEYKRALELNPNLADAHFRLGRYYLHAGEKEKGQAELETFKRLQAQHQAEIDTERAEVQQFVVSTKATPPTQP